MKTLFAPLCVSLILLVSCVRPPLVVTKPEEALLPVAMERALLNDDLGFRGMADAVRRSLEYYEKIPPDTGFVFGPERVTAMDMTVTLRNFLLIIENDTLSPDRKLERISQDFRFYRAAGGSSGTVLFTGYYEPLLSCRVAADEAHRFPLYRKPDDILEIDLALFGEGFPRNKIYGRLDNRKVVPYYSREEIDGKRMLAGKNLEILWCSDIVDISVLQVQGSGKVDLGNGDILSVLYDGSNGRPYKSIGKYLLDKGVMARETMSLQAIRAYLAAHPEQISEILNQNQSYVFFRLDTGPSVGNINVALTPNRSLATDSKLFPKGALAFIFAQKPVIENNTIKAWIPFTRFVLNQDTGGAIKGPGRADLFCGPGQDAELFAGNLKHEGELFFLIRRK